MRRTRVGYCGGTTTRPTYADIADHTEAVQIEFDARVTSYADLLELFYELHSPTYPPGKPQYRSRIFFHDEEQRRLAEEAKARASARLKQTIYTEIMPVGKFTRAEDYHQKYYLRANREIARDLLLSYPDPVAFADSTAAARLNGYLGGHATPDEIRDNLPKLGLTSYGQGAVRRATFLE